MAYAYYCSYCGNKLTQDTVLFDMQYLLTRDDTRQLYLLKFRMTQAELKKLLASGTPGEYGYKVCRLTMADIMKVVGNQNNLNDINIAELTQVDIQEYLLESIGGAYIMPRSIAMLEARSKALVDESFIKDLLSKDLAVLLGIFAENEYYEFQIREVNDVDNEGNPVLDGYSLKSVDGTLPIKARVCGRCGAPVFEHAGTARQQVVAFIGAPKSGKTGTILALTHYASYYMDNGFGGGKIWEGCQTIDSVSTVKIVDREDWKQKSLDAFEKGIAPPKFGWMRREPHPMITLSVSNKYESCRKRHLLSFLNVHGQVFMDPEGVHPGLIQEYVPAMLKCDAFVMCFDTQSLSGRNGTQTPSQQVADTCNWTDQFQNMRAQHKGVDAYVPTMVLFTKCDELVDKSAISLPYRPPLDRMYLLKTEKQQIAGNKMYRFVIDRFSSYGQLDKAYHAMMRCSAYGYSPPHIWDIEHAQRTGKAIDCHPPKPKNIDLLMRWLLSVTGCIPVEASFTRGIHDTPYRLENFSITRPQLRRQNPLKQHLMEESMARCALFENPGYFDRGFVAKHGQRVSIFDWLWREYRWHPNTNDR